jgi:glycosyltransferase involved in cell wall biosynthesis
MKVLVVSLYFKPIWEGGGPPRTAYALSKELVARGHEVTVYTTNCMSSDHGLVTNRPVEVDGMTVHYFENLRRFLPRPDLIPPLPYAVLNAARGEIEDFDIIHLHEHRTLLSAAVAMQAMKHGVPYVVQPHGSVLPAYQRQKTKLLFDRAIGLSMLRNADRLLALTGMEAEQLKTMGIDQQRIEMLPNGIAPEDFDIVSPPGSFRRKLGLSDEPLVLYLARFNRIKGPDILLRAFAQVVASIPEAHLAMVGPDDGYLAKAQEVVRENQLEDVVMFPGPIYDTKLKQAAYADSDVYVLPSRYETFPISVLEAWVARTPVIVSNRCGIKDDIGEAGEVVPLEPNSLSDSIIRALNDRAGGRQRGRIGREKVFQNYTWPLVVDRLEGILSEIVQMRRAADAGGRKR